MAGANVYLKSHEWARIEGDIATIGISDYAQESLGDVVFVELPEVGKELKQEETFAVVESVKAASDIFIPLSGEVIEVNETLEDEPELVNKDPLGEGWIVKIKVADASEASKLMAQEDYDNYTKELED
jgi:glycine cleavage system H protein